MSVNNEEDDIGCSRNAMTRCSNYGYTCLMCLVPFQIPPPNQTIYTVVTPDRYVVVSVYTIIVHLHNVRGPMI